MELLSNTITTPDGPFTYVVDAATNTVYASGWCNSTTELTSSLSKQQLQPIIDGGVIRASKAQSSISDAVEAYYDGCLNAINEVQTSVHGTELQRAGWLQLRSISPGETISYSQLAARLGRPKAVRAAASICARNPVALFTPCHRVLGADGALHGFAWGLEVKKALLQREGVNI